MSYAALINDSIKKLKNENLGRARAHAVQQVWTVERMCPLDGRRRCKKGRVSLAGPGGGADRALVRFGNAPRCSHCGHDDGPVPPPLNRCGRVTAPRNETAARASTSRQAIPTSSCFPVAPRIAWPAVDVNRHSSSLLLVIVPLRQRRYREKKNDFVKS